MARSRRPPPAPPAGSRTAGGEIPSTAPRRQGPVEGLVQEFVRRAATIGLGGFFLTEEAIRRAFNDVVPQDWVQFFVGQSEEMRRELINRLAEEFGAWLKRSDPAALSQFLLQHFDLSIRIDVTAHPREGASDEHSEE
jgi:hypothetical protein